MVGWMLEFTLLNIQHLVSCLARNATQKVIQYLAL